MDINLWAVLACGVFSMILGSVWYGSLFGKVWIRIVGATDMDMEKRKEMQKRVMPLYFVSFVLALFQAYVLAYYIEGLQEATGVENALWIWAAFIIPTVAAGAMWNNDSAKISWARFLIQAGHYLMLFVAFGIILSVW